MTLDLLQRQLLQLVKCEPTGPFDDAYLNEVAACEGLLAIRDIARSWNEFSVARMCPLTCRLLEQRGELAAAIAALTAAEQPSAFVEDLAALFLDQQVRSGVVIVADVARFEVAMLSLCLGRTTSEIVEWHHDPDVVLGSLAASRVVVASPVGTYRTVVSLDLPGLYRLCDPLPEGR